MWANAKSERKPSGHIIIEGQVIADTKQCCHCNRHFLSVKGSGERRGFCTHCMAVTCGSEKCDICTPFEAVLETWEGRKNKYTELIIHG